MTVIELQYEEFVTWEDHSWFSYGIVSRKAPPEAVEYFKDFNVFLKEQGHFSPRFIFEAEPLPPGLRYKPRAPVGLGTE